MKPHQAECTPRRDFLHALGVLAFVSFFSGCTLSRKQISIAAHVWPGYEFLFLARQLGWLDHNLVQLVETSSATDSLNALAKGRVHGAALTLDEVLRARANGIPLSIVLAFDISAGADVFLARKGLEQATALVGKTIGVEEGALGALMLAETLKKLGLSPDQIHVKSLTVDQHLEAWKRGEIDAVVTYEPVSTQLQDMGAIKLFDSRKLPDTIVDVLAVKTSILDDIEYGDAVRNVIEAHLKALSHFYVSPDDASFRMSKHQNLSADEVLGLYRGLVLPDLENNLRLLSGPTPALQASAEKLSFLMLQNKIVSKQDNLALLLRPEFLPRKL